MDKTLPEIGCTKEDYVACLEYARLNGYSAMYNSMSEDGYDPKVNWRELMTPKESTMLIFKVEAQGDTMYIKAATKAAAVNQLENFCGEIPEHMITWSEIPALPEGEEFL